MKFKIGDKVKYDGGEWLFYGSVNAIFDHSISPCYRINVDKIIKKSCKLSITQFEFELEADDETAEITENEILTEKIYAKLEEIESAATIFKHEIEESKRLNLLMDSVIEKQKASEVRENKQPKQEKGRRLKQQTQKQELEQEQVAALPSTVFESVVEIIEPVKKKIGRPKKIQIAEQKPVKKKATWYENFEKYKNGDRSNAINTWATQNRKEYKTGKMNEEKKDLLIGIRFPLMIVRKKR